VASRPLDQLSAESRAVLSLILLQSRSYADIASLLHLGESDVRGRAHAAAAALTGEENAPDAAIQARVIDYLLGEQSVSERAATRSALSDDPVARAWARRLADGLAPLVKNTPLPAIPDEPTEDAAEPDPATVPGATPPSPSPTPTPSAPGPEPAEVAEALDQPAQPEIVIRTRSPEDHLPPRQTRLPSSRFIVPALVAAVVIVVVIVILVSSGGGNSHSGATSTGASGQTHAVARFVLHGVGTASGAAGSGSVERRKTGLLLLLSARGLAANHGNSYGVWLFNSASDAHLLGFVDPRVGRAGIFSSGAGLPADATHFHGLIVTIETSTDPKTPGPIVLRASLTFS
jgi:hypothetical protein